MTMRPTAKPPMDEIADALRACEDVGMSPERVVRSLGAHQATFLALGTGPARFAADEIRAIALRLRQALAIYRLELECGVALHAGPRPKR